MRIPLFQRIGKLRRDEPRLHAVADEIVRILVDLLRPFLELRVLCFEKLRRRLGIVRRHVVPEYRLQALLFHNSPLPFQLQRVGRALRYGRKARRLAVVRRKIDLVRRLAYDRRIAVAVCDPAQLFIRQLPELRVFLLYPAEIFLDPLQLAAVVVLHAVHVVHVQKIELKIAVLCLILPHRCEGIRKARADPVAVDVGARAALGDPVSRALGVSPGIEVVPLKALASRSLGDPAHRVPGIHEHPHSPARDLLEVLAVIPLGLYDLGRDLFRRCGDRRPGSRVFRLRSLAAFR